MLPVAPSAATVAVLRAISQSGFAHDPTRKLTAAAGWRVVDDEPGLGYARFEMPLNSGESRLLTVRFDSGDKRPFALVPLYCFENYDECREPLDRAFRQLADHLVGLLGAPAQVGVYTQTHRPGWSYSFAGWSLTDATLLLVQDEFDIQFGMDVTLWVQPAGAALRVPLEVES